MSKSFRVLLLILSAIMVGLDQYTKYIARSAMTEYQSIEFMPHWNWILVYNHGAAFSFLSDQGGWQRYLFTLISLSVSAALVYFILKKPFDKITGFGYSFILGGAVGNLYDRGFVGKVTDFIDWYVAGYHWPAFNLADSFVCIGVALLLIEYVFIQKDGNN